MNQGSILVFDVVLINIGDGYNKNSGAFTASVHGIYFFMLSFMTYGNEVTALGIYVNDVVLCTGYEQNLSGSASCSAMTELQVGDIINVRATRNSALHYVRPAYKNQNALVGFLYKAL